MAFLFWILLIVGAGCFFAAGYLLAPRAAPPHVTEPAALPHALTSTARFPRSEPLDAADATPQAFFAATPDAAAPTAVAKPPSPPAPTVAPEPPTPVAPASPFLAVAVEEPTTVERVVPEATAEPEAEVEAEPTIAVVPDAKPEAVETHRTLDFRGDRLEHALREMCDRALFEGAVVADEAGLPVAVRESSIPVEILAAFTSVLGDTLGKADRLLRRPHANHIAMDLDFANKLVLRRFDADGARFHLLVICPQDADERAEVELSIEQLARLLHRPGSDDAPSFVSL